MSKSSFSRHLLVIEMDWPAEMYTLRGHERTSYDSSEPEKGRIQPEDFQQL